MTSLQSVLRDEEQIKKNAGKSPQTRPINSNSNHYSNTGINLVTTNSSGSTTNSSIDYNPVSYALLQYKPWKNKEILSQIVSSDYNESIFLTTTMHNTSQILSSLTSLLAELDVELSSQVTSKHSDLLSQASHLTTLQSTLHSTRSRLLSLHNSVSRIESSINQSYQSLKNGSIELSHIQSTAELARQCLRIVSSVEKLNISLQPSDSLRDLVKSATYISDIFNCMSETDTKGIHVIDKLIPYINQSGEMIRSSGSAAMTKGMESLNHNDIASALQLFCNLGFFELANIIDQNLIRVEEIALTTLRQTLDVSTMQNTKPFTSNNNSNNSSNSNTSVPAPRIVLWERMDAMIDILFNLLLQIYSLEIVMNKKKDINTGAIMKEHYVNQKRQIRKIRLGEGGEVVRNEQTTSTKLNTNQTTNYSTNSNVNDDIALAVTNSFDNLLLTFWSNLITLFSQELESTVKSSTFIRTIFSNEYPRLAIIHFNLQKKINNALITNNHTPRSNNNIYSHITNNDNANIPLNHSLPSLLSVYELFELEYIKRQYSKLVEPINLMFSSNVIIPTKSDINTYIHVIYDLLYNIYECNNESLIKHICHNVNKSIILLSNQFEKKINRNDDKDIFPMNIISVTNNNINNIIQRHNAELFIIVYHTYIQLSVNELHKKYPLLTEELKIYLSPAINAIHEVIKELILLLIMNVTRSIDQTFYTLFDEYKEISHKQGSNNSPNVPSDGSTYIQTIKKKILYLNKTILPLYGATGSIAAINQNSNNNSLVEFIPYLDSFGLHILSLYIRLLSLYSPFTESVKLRMVHDITLLEEHILLLLGIDKKNHHQHLQLLSDYKELLFLTNLSDIQTFISKTNISPIDIIHYLFTISALSVPPMPRLLSLSIQDYIKRLDECRQDNERYELLLGAYERIEESIKVPLGEQGKTFIQQNYPYLHAAFKLIQQGIKNTFKTI